MSTLQAIVKRALLQVPARRAVYGLVATTPGIHVRSLSRDLHMALGTVQHHVRQLEKHELLFALQMGRRRGLFCTADVDCQDAPIIYCYRKPAWQELLVLLLDGEMGVAEIAAATNTPVSTASYNLRRLRDVGLVQRVPVGRQSIYLLSDPRRVRAVATRLQTRPEAAFVGLVSRAGAQVPLLAQ